MVTKLQDENTFLQPAMFSEQRTLKEPTALVFDSGVGGLSVYQELRKLRPDLHYIYAFDHEGFPYGEKEDEFIIARVTTIVAEIQKRHSLDVIIIACNTASTLTLPKLRERFKVAIVGVVPAIKPAAKLTCNGIVGLLATKATVQRTYTQELIAQFASTCEIKMLGSSELVLLAEDKLYGQPVDKQQLEAILYPWLSMSVSPDTVVLGCTHFPLLREELIAVLPEGTRLVDSGAAIARRVAWLVADRPIVLHEAPINKVYTTLLNDETLRLNPVFEQMGFQRIKVLRV